MTPSTNETNGRTTYVAGRAMRGVRGSALLALIAGFTCLLSTTPAIAANAEAQMTVSARVLARAVVTLENAPGSINVTAEDVSRGFIEIAAPLTVRVKTTSRAGSLRTVSRMPASFSPVTLHF